MGKNIIGIIGVAASLGGLVAGVIGNWADKRGTEILVEEMVDKALAEKKEEEEESEEETEEND